MLENMDMTQHILQKQKLCDSSWVLQLAGRE